LTPHDFFGTAFWLGFTIQLMAAEVWINPARTHTLGILGLYPALGCACNVVRFAWPVTSAHCAHVISSVALSLEDQLTVGGEVR
jgi:hypothetical protein